MSVIGIDLGTSALRVAIAEADHAEILSLDGSDDQIPIALSLSGDSTLWGQSALGRAVTHPGETVTRFLTREEPRSLELNGRKLDQLEVTTLFFEQIATRISSRIESAPQHTSIAITDEADVGRRQLLSAVIEGGPLGFAELLAESEAIASALTPSLASSQVTLVVDLGASSTSLTAIEGDDGGSPQVIARLGRSVGGDQVDVSLVDAQLQRLGVSAPAPGVREMIRQACGEMKRELATVRESRRTMPYLPGTAAPAELVLSRELFASALAPVTSALDQLFSELRRRGIQTDQILLIGGLSHAPLVVEAVAKVCGGPPRRSSSPTGLIALGVARLGATRAEESTRSAVLPPPAPPPSTVTAAPSPRPSPEQDRTDHPRVTMMPPSRSSIAPGRPSVAAAAPTSIGAGKLVNPSSLDDLYELPLTRPLEPGDLDPIAVVTLLLRVVGRPSVNGTLELTPEKGRPVRLPVLEGRALVTELSHSATVRISSLPSGRYAFTSGTPKLSDMSEPLSMLQLVSDCLRAALRTIKIEALKARLESKLSLGPYMSERRRLAASRLNLSPPESRLITLGFDGYRRGLELVEGGGLGPKTVLQLLTLFELFQIVEWREVAQKQSRPSFVDELRERAETARKTNHFEALSVHWSASSVEIEDAHGRVSALTSPGGRWYEADRDAAATLKQRADEAYAVLADEAARTKYRAETFGKKNYRAVAEFLSQKARAESLKSDQKDFQDTVQQLQEVRRTTTKIPQRPANLKIDQGEDQ